MARQYGTRSVSSEEARAYVESIQEAEEASRLKMEKYIGIGLTVIGAVILLIGIMAKVTCPSKIASLNEMIAGVTEDYEDRKALNDEGAEIEWVNPVINSAKKSGLDIMSLQERLMAYDESYWYDVRSAKAGTSVDFTPEHKQAIVDLRKYFGARSGQAGSIWSYYGFWEFGSIFDYEGTDLPVAWVCYDEQEPDKRIPLVIVTGTYKAASSLKDLSSDPLAEVNAAGTVSDFMRYITPAYTARVSADALRNNKVSGSVNVENPTALPFDQAGDYTAGAPNGMTDEEATEWLRQKQEEAERNKQQGQDQDSSGMTGQWTQDGSSSDSGGTDQWGRTGTN